MKSLFNIDLFDIDIQIYNMNYFNSIPSSVYTFTDNSIYDDNDTDIKLIDGFWKKIFMNKPDRLLLKALKLIKKGNKTQAIRTLNKCIDEVEDYIDALYLLFIISAKQETREELIKRIVNNTDNYGSFFQKYNIGFNFYTSLTADINLNINNDYTGLFICLGIYYLNSEEFDKGIELLNGDIPDHPLIKLLKAELYMAKKNNNQAILLLQNIDDNEIICLYTMLLLGKAFREEGMLKTSIAILRKSRRSSEKKPISLILEARYQLALSFEEYGRLYLAKKEYQKILAMQYKYRDVKEKINKFNSI